MKPLTIEIKVQGKPTMLTVNQINGLFEIVDHGRVIAALRPPGEDWELLTMEELIENLPLYENDLSKGDSLQLHTAEMTQIIGKIESHLNGSF